jgi:gamma-glutamylaminecyclotransferase
MLSKITSLLQELAVEIDSFRSAVESLGPKFLVAVYGTLRKGASRSQALSPSDHVGTTRIKGRLHHVTKATFPTIVLDMEHSPGVVVDVYEVDLLTMLALDQIEGCPDMYSRTKVDTEFGQAWVYYLDPTTYARVIGEQVPSGDWLDVPQPTKGAKR